MRIKFSMTKTQHAQVVCLVFIFETLITCLEGYDLRCPAKPQWKIRATNNCSKAEEYHCLYNPITGKFIEICQTAKEYARGQKVVYRGNLNAEPCSNQRYMPLFAVSNMSQECLYIKSTCNEEGQVIQDHRSSGQDTTCVCDYTQGYVFASTPKNKCYCIPSEEDCSCVMNKTCDSIYNFISSDYKCVEKTEPIDNLRCHLTINTAYRISRIVKPTKLIYLNDNIDDISLPIFCLKVPWMLLTLTCLMLTSIELHVILILCHLMFTEEDSIQGIDFGKIKKTPTGILVFNRFLINSNTAKYIFFSDDLRWDRNSKPPRILDMCFFRYDSTLFLVYLDADNSHILKRDILNENNEPEKKDLSGSHEPNRLAKINNTKIAIIYKKHYDIMEFNVISMEEGPKYTVISPVNTKLPKCLEHGIQGIVALSPTKLILSDKTTLFTCELSSGIDTPIKLRVFGHSEDKFDTARRLTHVTKTDSSNDQGEDIIFIADENDKLIVSESVNESEIDEQKSHQRGLQNVRAIVATRERVYAATSAGISVYCHDKGKFYEFDKSNVYKMLLEYELHVEHTRSISLEKIDQRIYVGISGVIKQKDFIFEFSFDESKDFR